LFFICRIINSINYISILSSEQLQNNQYLIKYKMIYKFSKFILFICSVLYVYAETLTEYLNEAKLLSSQGKFGDALNSYNKAIG